MQWSTGFCLQIERGFSGSKYILLYVAATDRVVLFHIGEGKANSWLSISDANFKMDAKVLFRGCEELNVELDKRGGTYLPIRLQALTSAVGSGTVTVLLERMEPVILNDFLAMVGSLLSERVRE
jgi:hypothetical protein